MPFSLEAAKLMILLSMLIDVLLNSDQTLGEGT